MSLIKSISGIRGTIGGRIGEGLNPLDTVRFTAAYSAFIQSRSISGNKKIVVGRDARISGEMLNQLVTGTLLGMGFDVVDIGLASTPSTELAVTLEKAAGGIILTASHNPKHWNALKLLNSAGEFLNAEEGEMLLKIAENNDFIFADIENIGKYCQRHDFEKHHIENIISLPLVDVEAIKKANFTIAIDAVNSVGGIIIPALLQALGVNKITKINCEPTGIFAHNPEPLPEHLTEISAIMRQGGTDAGFVVDPDVDRLAIIAENGEMFGEEYTLVAVADYVLQNTAGNTVSNLSSTRALHDITERYGKKYSAAAVGEVNVVQKMKEIGAVIGGEGNGGIIYPESHYGRDALAGIALFLTHLAKSGKSVSELRKTYPAYFISKNKIELSPKINIDQILVEIKNQYNFGCEINDSDGIKIDFPDCWVHLRKSNTEPIIRIYSEAKSVEKAELLANEIICKIKQLL